MPGPLAKLGRRIMMLVARARVTAAEDATPLQTMSLDLLADEHKDGVERLQNYGFSARPHAGADALVIFIGGNRDHGVVLGADDRRYRPADLKPGEVVVYDDLGHEIRLTRTGLSITAPETIEIAAPNISITGQVALDGDITADGITFKSHVHPENDSGGPTSQPIPG